MSNLKSFVRSRNQTSNDDLRLLVPGQYGAEQPRYTGHDGRSLPMTATASMVKPESPNEPALPDSEGPSYGESSILPGDLASRTELSFARQHPLHNHNTDFPLEHEQQLPQRYFAPLLQMRKVKQDALYDAKIAEAKRQIWANTSAQATARQPFTPTVLRSNSYPTTSSGNQSPVEDVIDHIHPRSNECIPITSDDRTKDGLDLEQPSEDIQAEPPTPQRSLSSSPQRDQFAQHPYTRRHPFLKEPAHSPDVHAAPTGESANYVHLDYGKAKLHTMDYADLKALPFDENPNIKPFELFNKKDEDTLSSKLELVAELSETEQKQFFASLMISEWEEAGDWFLGRFGDVFNQLKELRREMRAASLALENKCETRYMAVEEKRMGTEAALAQMRERGKKVLQSSE